MSVEGNIHVLMAQLTPDKVRAYLLRTGWTLTGEPDERRVHFQGRAEEGEPPYRVAIPSASHWRALRGRLQTALFALSTVENREPLEIARDMLAEPISPLVSPGEGADGSRCLRVRNDGACATTVEFRMLINRVRLEPGESVTLVLGDTEEGPPEITLRDGTICISRYCPRS